MKHKHPMWPRTAALAALPLCLGLAHAQPAPLTDPTRPPHVQRPMAPAAPTAGAGQGAATASVPLPPGVQPATAPAPARAPSPAAAQASAHRLTSVMLSARPELGVAIIDGQVVRVGEPVPGPDGHPGVERLLAVDARGASVKGPRGVQRLSLYARPPDPVANGSGHDERGASPRDARRDPAPETDGRAGASTEAGSRPTDKDTP